MLSFACKGATVLEINKQTMKTNNIRKLVRTNYVTNVYKNWDCWGLLWINFFFHVQKKKKNYSWCIFCQEIGNITFFLRPNKNELI